MKWNNSRMVIVCISALPLVSSDSARESRSIPFITAAAKPVRTDHVPKTNTPFAIYLTFDDGPSSGSTWVNELSRENELPVNVFLIGNNVYHSRSNRQLLQDYQSNPYIEIGNHSFSHAQRRYRQYFKDPREVLADFDRVRDSLHLTNGLIRLPGRNFFRVGGLYRDDLSNGEEAADTLAAKGYKIFGWDVEWRRQPAKGFETHSAQEMLDIVNEMLLRQKTFLPGRLVLLLHDQELKDEHFREELITFIRLVRTDGRFSFDHLSNFGEVAH